MAKLLYKKTKNKKHIRLYWSKDWFSLEPWAVDGEVRKFFDHYVSYSDDKQCKVIMIMVGPLAIIFGRLINGN
jgi:hypothetical protein